MVQDLCNFLGDELYKEFVNESLAHKGLSFQFEEFCDDREICQIIYCSFCWANSKRGFAFWYKKHKEAEELENDARKTL